MSTKPPDVILARCTMMLRGSGDVEILVSNIDPKEFLKTAKETSPAWEDAELVARGIEFIADKFEKIDKELDEYVGSII